jgi:two-component system CheB/CheR fusion protein
LKDPDGRLQGVSAVVLDVTDRKAVEREILALNENLEERVAERTTELKNSNWALQEEVARRKQAQETAARLAAIVESSDDAIVAKTLDGTVTSWNEAAEHIYGYTAQEMLGRSIYIMVPPEEREEMQRIHKRVQQGEFVEHHEVRRVRKDGREIVVSLTNSPVRNEKGAIVGIAAIGRDITRQKRMEQALRESQARLSAIVDTAGDGLITIDDHAVVQSFNKTAEKLFGFTADEVIGHNINMLMPAPFHEAHDGYLANYLTTGVKKIIDIGREVVARRKDGSTFPIDLAVSEFHEGTRRQFTGLIRDISTRKHLEKEVLEVATEEQRRIGQDLHDSVGQELTGLGLVAETLADALTQQGHPDAPLADKISAGARRALSEVRALSRGLIPVEVDATGLPTALGELAARVQEQANVKCTFTCDPSFRWDDNAAATHYYRIAQEAVTNALKHGRAKQIEIRLNAQDGRIALSVWNDGVSFADNGGANGGLGLKIMRYRAGLIDAALHIGPAAQGGTILSCTLIQENSNDQDGTPDS